MIVIDIPGWKKLNLEYCVIDLNGTLSQSGVIAPGAQERMGQLSSQFRIVVLPADTRGNAELLLRDVPVEVHILKSAAETTEKEAFVCSIGQEKVAYIGNGANDELAMRASTLSICIVGTEGCYGRTAFTADVLVSSINAALDLLIFPERLVATLRR